MRSPNRMALLALLALLACPTAARADTQVAPTHVTPQASTAVETSHVVPTQGAGPGTWLHGASVTTGATAGYFIILNLAADPGNGAIAPKKCVYAAANQTVGMGADADTMWDFPAGAVLLFSTTGCFLETQSATAFFSWQ